MYTYSFDLSNFESGKFTATRYTGMVAVGGSWVCRAESDEEALRLAKQASNKEWAAPDTRPHDDFTVEFWPANHAPA